MITEGMNSDVPGDTEKKISSAISTKVGGDVTLLSTAYLGPIQYYSKLIHHPKCVIEHYENYIKQTYRSRCEVYSPNGLHTMSVPLIKRGKRQVIKDIKISYDYNWQQLHWRTLESSYRRSPYFEYYEDDFRPFYDDKKFSYLIDLNEALQQVVLELLRVDVKYEFTTSYKAHYADTDDFRSVIDPKEPLEKDVQFQAKRYTQVFEPRSGFISNLSIVDLLFNEGSRALEFI